MGPKETHFLVTDIWIENQQNILYSALDLWQSKDPYTETSKINIFGM